METFTLPSFLVSFGGYVISWLGISYGIHRLFEKAEEVLNVLAYFPSNWYIL